MRNFVCSILSMLLVASLQAPTWAASLPEAAPASLGLSAERLDRFRPLIEQRLKEERLAGAVVLIARRGKVAYFKSFGVSDKASGRAMAPDTIMRIYSMTKPIVAVAALMLYEEGKFDLRDEVADYIPEFADMKVATPQKDGTVALVPAEHRITILDLMRHTSGLGYYYTKNEKGEPYYKDFGVYRTDLPLAEWVPALAKAPLLHQPGTTFEYSYSVDVLGRLIEIWSGRPLDQFLAERVFKPLGMTDTGFFVPPEKQSRLATLYTPHPLGRISADEQILELGGPVQRFEGGPQDAFNAKPALLSGGGGLVSTASDYAKFCLMLASGGALDNTRLLSPKTVDLINADVLGDRARAGGAPWRGDGFGLTVEVSRSPGETGTIVSAGEYDWGGVASTSMFVDPQEQMIGVLMMQVIPGSPYWGRMLRQLATQAIVEEQD